ncbi:MAG: DUF1573 domain-containing protein [Bacteroidales bacterium]|jgi:hypothetical protein|nr:DUF1573 domain-containing protein [Bacteroidales bacterium]
MRRRLIIVAGLLLLVSGKLFCQNAQPVSSQQEDNKPYFSLEKKTINFGEIEMGTTKTLLLSFTNTGKKTLVLSEVYTTCGCTTVDWPKDPFLPGKSGKIKISYNPTETGPFNKTISIYTNAQNSSEVVQIEGIVIDK